MAKLALAQIGNSVSVLQVHQHHLVFSVGLVFFVAPPLMESHPSVSYSRWIEPHLMRKNSTNYWSLQLRSTPKPPGPSSRHTMI